VPEFNRLDELERERFSNAVEAAFEVAVRPKFFVWTQGAVQGLLSHDVLICGILDGSRQGMALHRFSSTRYFKQEHFDALCDPAAGLVPRLMAAADPQRSTVITVPALQPRGRSAESDLAALVADNELKNLSALLVPGVRGKVEAFYAFARLARDPDERTAYLTELLAPHVHSAFMRVLAGERQGGAVETRRAGRLITERQEQILNLVKSGKTNSEIAEVLECSPWTIKNHIQAILRKLDTNTRGHAIARAISLGILQSD
jgi:transcriptional regulator EpsA